MSKKTKKTRLFDGLPVVDADSDLSLVIKPVDIAKSSRKNPSSCAAAIAGSRELKTEVKVFISRLYVKDKNKWVRYMTPENISREITSFDRGSSFEPGEYMFKKPSKSAKLGQVKSERHDNTGKGKKIKSNHITANIRVSGKSEYHQK